MRKRTAAFTLVELIAVVLIFGLLAGITLPRMDFRTGRVLDEQARRIAADLEFVRQRAVMTGAPHRLMVDLDELAWWLEWWIPDVRLAEEEEPPPSAAQRAEREAAALSGQGPLDVAPPRTGEASWRRLMGPAGDVRRLDSLVFLDHVETPEGAFEQGEIELVFGEDGTTQPTWIVLALDDGRSATLEVEPLADTVRFEHGSL